MGEPLWLEDPSEPVPRPAWESRAYVIIIGDGFTGCSRSLALVDAGRAGPLARGTPGRVGSEWANGVFALRGGAPP